jgi:hypothetical protein
MSNNLGIRLFELRIHEYMTYEFRSELPQRLRHNFGLSRTSKLSLYFKTRKSCILNSSLKKKLIDNQFLKRSFRFSLSIMHQLGPAHGRSLNELIKTIGQQEGETKKENDKDQTWAISLNVAGSQRN